MASENFFEPFVPFRPTYLIWVPTYLGPYKAISTGPTYLDREINGATDHKIMEQENFGRFWPFQPT